MVCDEYEAYCINDLNSFKGKNLHGLFCPFDKTGLNKYGQL